MVGWSGVPNLFAVLPVHTSTAGAPACLGEHLLLSSRTLHRARLTGVAATRWPLVSLLCPQPAPCTHCITMCLTAKGIFFFYTKLWLLVCDSDPRSAFVAEKHQQVFQRSCFFRFLSLFSLDLPFLSYLSCMQTHAKKTLPLLSAPARAHYYIPISVHMQGWEVMSETREGLGQRSCEGWTCYTS